jgi:ABC-type uncharacterized transport system permease subunit
LDDVSPNRISESSTSFFRSFSVNTICLETTFFALVLIPLAAFILYRTRLDSAFVRVASIRKPAPLWALNVMGYRYAGVTISGFLAGIGGTAYILASTSDVYGDVAGIGFLALAVMIFGNWDAIKILGSRNLLRFLQNLGAI